MTNSRLPLTLVLLFLAVLVIVSWFFLREEGGEDFARPFDPDSDDRPTLYEPRRRTEGDAPAEDSTGRSVVDENREFRGRLEGRIEGPAGFDLTEVRVLLEKAWRETGDDPDFRRETRPDAEGGYEFGGLDPQCDYVVTLEAPGRRILPHRNTRLRIGAEAPTFFVAPVLACAPRLLDPSGFEVSPVEGRLFRFDMRQLEREGLELIPECRLHGLRREDIALAQGGVGLFVVPREKKGPTFLSLTADLNAPGYQPQRITLGLIELNAGSPVPRPVHALWPRPEARPVTLALRYDDGGLPLGRSDLEIGHNIGWQFLDVYRLMSFDLADLPGAVFRLSPGLHVLDIRDGRLRRSFEVEEGKGPLRVDLSVPRGGDIVIELPREGAPYRLAGPARDLAFNAPESFELPTREYVDLAAGLWSFAAVDRRGRRVEGRVELERGQRYVWRPFAD